MEKDEKFYKELNDLIDKYGFNKGEYESYKAICDEGNKQIKEMMAEAGLKNYNTDRYKVTYIVSERTSMNEAKLIGVIHSNNIPNSLGIIKTREYIDEDALESAIYNGEISDDVMAQIAECMDKKEVISLKLTAKRGE